MTARKLPTKGPHIRKIVLCLLFVSPCYALIDGELDNRSEGKVSIQLTILRGATVDSPIGLTRGNGKGPPEHSPAKPRWLVQNADPGEQTQFSVCLPSIYEGGEIVLVSAPNDKKLTASNNKQAGAPPKESTNNGNSSFTVDTASSTEGENYCRGNGKKLDIAMPSQDLNTLVPGSTEVSVITMLITPE
ncbi:MAG: hypothetical protein ACI9B8_000253 [Sulfitobacter sp.]|jgi:hypothetical protein